MSNIFSSSIGKKLIMSLSGLFLILFLLIHMTANIFIFVSPEAFNTACHIMSYMTPIVPILAVGFFVHILYAFILTLKNRKARPVKYDKHIQGKTSTWESRNMFVLGIIVFGILILHLTDFWAKMQLAEWMGTVEVGLDKNGNFDFFQIIKAKFVNPIFVGIYVIWVIALWFHLRHGFWSAFQSVGLNNQIWIKRWKCLANLYALLVLLVFISIPIFVMVKYGTILQCAL